MTRLCQKFPRRFLPDSRSSAERLRVLSILIFPASIIRHGLLQRQWWISRWLMLKNTKFNDKYGNLYVQPAQMSSSVFADIHFKRRTAQSAQTPGTNIQIFIDLVKRFQCK
jgi:hypothetical protein